VVLLEIQQRVVLDQRDVAVLDVLPVQVFVHVEEGPELLSRKVALPEVIEVCI
jgi:hypothetical protein